MLSNWTIFLSVFLCISYIRYSQPHPASHFFSPSLIPSLFPSLPSFYCSAYRLQESEQQQQQPRRKKTMSRYQIHLNNRSIFLASMPRLHFQGASASAAEIRQRPIPSKISLPSLPLSIPIPSPPSHFFQFSPALSVAVGRLIASSHSLYLSKNDVLISFLRPRPLLWKRTARKESFSKVKEAGKRASGRAGSMVERKD